MSSDGTTPGNIVESISANTAGAILQPQPPPCENCVNRTVSSAFMLLIMLLFYFALQAQDYHVCRSPTNPLPNEKT